MREVILYGNHASRHSYKVRLFLALADLDRLDQELSRRPFLAGEASSIANLSAAAYVFLAPESGLDLAGWPAVNAWLGRIRALPRWQEQYTPMAR